MRWASWLAAFAFILLFTAPAFAQTFPPLTGRVVDNAHLLTPEQAAGLDAKLAALEQQSTRQMVVATVPSLEGYEIDDYGYRLGRAWGIGDKKANNGLLLLIAPNERKVRIEVGYGLEPIVTDALSAIVIQRTILPRFKAGDMGGGIVAGADQLLGLLQLPPEEAAAQSQKLVAAEKKRDKGHFPISLVFWIVVILFVIGSNIANRFGGRRYRSGGSGLPIVIWGGGGGWGGGSGGSDWGGGGGGGFSGGGGSFGGGGSSGGW